MSRWIEQLPDGTYKEEVYDKDGCKHLYNEVCCNDHAKRAVIFLIQRNIANRANYLSRRTDTWT